ncbi:hypothetical protein PG991_015366 [Apiospora marii]|uniref:Uncharacterized protein n=1 Tax=Apiospora marii TaxID=335849 RepID=A0ABR1R255_9PEZI
MYLSLALATVAVAIFARGVHGDTTGIQGRDFDFSVVYPSGLTFSTSKPPGEVISLRDVLYDVPEITFADPASLAPASDNDAPQYLSFLEISFVPANGTASPSSDGRLVDSRKGWRRPDEVESGEVRNASLHVWRQTPELVEYLFGAGNTVRWPLFFQVASIWSHSTSKVDYDFELANIDFKVRNETGRARCDVDDQGASIVGATKTACATTVAPTSIGPSGVRTGTAGEPTAGSGTGSAESPGASTPSIASSRAALPATWLAVCLTLVLSMVYL